MRRLFVACLAGAILLGTVGATKRASTAKARKPVAAVPAAAVRAAPPAATTPAATAAPAHTLTPAPNLSKAELEGLIFQRQEIMKQLDTDAETLGNIAAGIVPRTKLAAATRAVAISAKESRDSFKLHIPGGRSKPEVWTNYADFMQRMDTFVQETEELAKLGEAGEFNAVTEKLVSALPCKACHDNYRGPRKPSV